MSFFVSFLSGHFSNICGKNKQDIQYKTIAGCSLINCIVGAEQISKTPPKYIPIVLTSTVAIHWLAFYLGNLTTRPNM